MILMIQMCNRAVHLLIYISDRVDIKTRYPMHQYKAHHTNMTASIQPMSSPPFFTSMQ